MAQRFGLQTVDLLQAQPNGSQDTYFFFNKYYLQKTADGDFQQVHNVLQGQIQAAPFPTLYNSYTSKGYQLDHLSRYDFIRQYLTARHRSHTLQLLHRTYYDE